MATTGAVRERPTGSGGDPAASLMTGGPGPAEKIIKAALFLAAIFSVLVTLGIVISLLIPNITFFSNVSFTEFLFGTQWTAAFGDKSSWTDKAWGVLPLVVGTLVATGIALLVAVPLGLGSAVLLSEYASNRVRRVVKPILEILAGVPTVVYGFLALTVLTPALKTFLPIEGIYNQLSAGLVMGFMIVPTVASLSEDAMSAVPMGLRQGSYALGANRMTTTIRVVFPAALSGIVAAIVLAISRAIGETMILAIAAGNEAKLTLNPLVGAQTMTGYIAQIASGDAPQGSPVYYSLFAVGALLFVMTFIINLISIRLVRRFRQVY
jgi:phosphate transport system permease protein